MIFLKVIYLQCAIMNTQCVLFVLGESERDCGSKMGEFRESTGMNRKEFCQFLVFHIGRLRIGN